MPQDDLEPTPIDPGSLPADTYAHGLRYPSHESMAAEATPASDSGLSDEATSFDAPVAEVTVGPYDSAYVTESFDQDILAELLDGPSAMSDGTQTPAGFLGAVGVCAETEFVDVVINQMAVDGGILPATGIENFFVLVNGIPREVVSAARRGDTDHYDLRTVRLTLAYPVVAGDIIEVTYIDRSPASGAVSDTDGNYLPGFSLIEALNCTPGRFGTVLEWLDGLHEEPFCEPRADISIQARLLEHRVGYPSAKVVLDKVAPYGQVIINEDTAAGGVKVHLFEALNGSGVPLSGTDFLENLEGAAVRKAGAMAGKDDESLYEVIGTGGIGSVAKRLAKVSGNYPEMKTVRFCCISAVPKTVVVDAKKALSDNWSPVFFSVANDISREYYSVNLAAPVRTAAVRLRHGGDVYAASEDASLTVVGSDALSGVAQVQIAHYSDFRDAADFVGADADGWFDFTDGVSLFDWDLLNADRIWMQKRGMAAEGIQLLASVSGNLVALTQSKAYVWSAASGLTEQQDFGAAEVKSAAVHKTDLFVGLSDGRVMRSSNGSTYEQVNSSTPMRSVNALESHGGRLWAGTAKDADGLASVFHYDGTSWTLSRTFDAGDVTCMESTAKYLFVGLSGAVNSRAGIIYLNDGSQWAATRQTDTDRVDALGYGGGFLWAGLSGGILHTLSFDGSGTATTWDIPPQTSDASTFYSIRGSSDGRFVWFSTDTGMLVYYSPNTSFSLLEGPAVYPGGLTATYTESNLANYKDTGYLPGGLEQTSVVETTVEQDDLIERAAGLTPAIDTTYFNVSWTGFVRADYTEEYTFYLESQEGGRLYVGGELVGNDWVGGTLVVDNWDTPGTSERRGKINLIAGQMVPIRVEVYRSSGASRVKLSWSSTSVGKEVVPAPSLFLSKTASSRADTFDVIESGGEQVFGASDGRLYALDTESITSRVRRVYARFKDNAGNVGAGYLVANDFIIQDAERRAGEVVSSGKIYQVTQDKQVVATFQPQQQGALYAPDRRTRVSGIYESVPYYVAALTRWDEISFAATLDAGSEQGGGLERGVEVRLYVRTGDTRDELMAAEWGDAYTRSTIPPDTDSGYVDTALVGDFSLEPIEQKKWLQFRLELVTAQRNVTPVVHAVTLSYLAAQATYFFSTMFDTSDYSAEVPAPEFRRGILTANMLPNGGIVKFGYTISEEEGATFDFAQYTEIEPNRVFKLPVASDKIRFGIMIVSISSVYPAVVDEFGAIMDAGTSDMNFMG